MGKTRTIPLGFGLIMGVVASATPARACRLDITVESKKASDVIIRGVDLQGRKTRYKPNTVQPTVGRRPTEQY